MQQTGPQSIQVKESCSKEIIINRIREIIESRSELNQDFADFLSISSQNEIAEKLFLSHFIKPEFHDSFCIEVRKKLNGQSFASYLAQLCKDDASLFRSFSYCFEQPNSDAVINELFFYAQFRAKQQLNPECLIENERSFLGEIMKHASSIINKDLFRFTITYRQILQEEGMPHHKQIFKYGPAINDCLEKCNAIKTSEQTNEIHETEKELKKISRLSKEPMTLLENAKLFYRLYNCYQQLTNLLEQHLNDAFTKNNKENIKPPEKPGIEEKEIPPSVPPIIPIPSVQAPLQIEEDYLPAITTEKNLPKKKLRDPQTTLPLYLSKRKLQKQEAIAQKKAKKSALTLDFKKGETPESLAQQAKQDRIAFYRKKLSRFKDLMETIFRENTPHLEVSWSEVEKMLHAIGAKINQAEGSRITLVFEENTIHEKWANILKPIHLSQRGIHKSHRPGKCDDLIAGIYIDILRKALIRFGLTPQILWPVNEQDICAGVKRLHLKSH